ncbi:MAG: geranylgeranyl reductase family protein [Dehalococcoidia bacterium]
MAYDVIIAGGGPAGSTTGRLLAERGARVLLLDKQAFPRDKPCGGGVTLRAASAQGADLSKVVERTVYGARFSLRLGPEFDRRFTQPLSYMTQRLRLDSHLLEQAAGAGVEVHEQEAVRAVDASSSGVQVLTSRDSHSAQILIGADGANGITGRLLGLRREYEEAVAFEGNIPWTSAVSRDWEDLVALDLGGLAGGYGWVFPKGEHLNVGVGAWKYASFTLRPKLVALARRYGFDEAKLENLRGHHLPVRMAGSPIARGPVAVVGDAAGLIDPLTGEGIHMAFASGRLAAEAALKVLGGAATGMETYQREVDTGLQPELTVSRQLQEIFNFAPPPFLTLMRRNRRFWLFFCYLIRGDLTYLDFVRMIGPMRVAVTFFSGVSQRKRQGKVSAGLRAITTSS